MINMRRMLLVIGFICTSTMATEYIQHADAVLSEHHKLQEILTKLDEWDDEIERLELPRPFSHANQYTIEDQVPLPKIIIDKQRIEDYPIYPNVIEEESDELEFLKYSRSLSSADEIEGDHIPEFDGTVRRFNEAEIDFLFKKVTLPPKDILIQRFRSAQMGHFAEKTNIVEMLTDCDQKTISGIITAVECMLDDYKDDMKDRMPEKMALRDNVITAILADHPDIIQKMRQHDLLEKVRSKSLYSNTFSTYQSIKHQQSLSKNQSSTVSCPQSKLQSSHTSQSSSPQRTISASECNQQFKQEQDQFLQKIKEEMHQMRQEYLARDTVNGALHIGESLVHKYGNRIAQRAFTFAHAAYKAYDLINNSGAIASAGSTGGSGLTGLLAGMNPYVAVGGIFLPLIMGHTNKDKSMAKAMRQMHEFMETIHRGIICLSRQMDEFRNENRAYFEHMEKTLHEHDRRTMLGFLDLHKDVAHIEQNVEKLAQQWKEGQEQTNAGLEYIANSMQHNQQLFLTAFANEHLAKTERLVTRTLANKDNASEVVDSCLEKLALQAIVHAKQANVNGGSLALDTDDINGALAAPHSNELWNHPIFSHTSLIARLCAQSEERSPEQLVNPIIWGKSTEALLKVLYHRLANDAHNPTTVEQKERMLEYLKSIAQEGEKLITAAECVQKGTTIDQTLHEYEQAYANIVALVDTQIKEYENKQTQELQSVHKDTAERQKTTMANVPAVTFSRALHNAAEITNVQRYCSGDRSYYSAVAKYGFRQFFFELGPQNVYEPETWKSGTIQCSKEALQNHLAQQHTSIQKNIMERIEENSQNYSVQSNFTLFTDDETPVCSINNIIIHAQEGKSYTVPLHMPEQLLQIDPAFLINEKHRLNTMCFEYTWENNKFFINAYSSDAQGKHLLHSWSVDADMGAPFTTNEDVKNFWDQRWLSTNNADHRTTKVHVHNSTIARVNGIPYIPTPPLLVSGARDTFTATAQKNDAADLPALIDAQKNALATYKKGHRIRFNTELQTQATVPGQPLATALNRFDRSFKLLDALFAFGYNETYGQHLATAALHKQEPLYLKDKETIVRFLQAYSQSDYPKSTDYITTFLNRSKQEVQTQVQAICSIKSEKPFPAIQKTLEGISALMQRYAHQEIKVQKPIPLAVDQEQYKQLLAQNASLQESMQRMEQQILLLTKLLVEKDLNK